MSESSEETEESSQGFPRLSFLSTKGISLVLLGFLLAFVVIELTLRVYYWATDKRLFGLPPVRTTIVWADDQILGRKLVPNQSGWFVPHTKEYYTFIEVNSHGWPDVEHAYEKPDGVYRILFLGDSFVENTQVPLEKRFFRQAEEKLNSQDDNNVNHYEVIATGQGDTGTAQQLVSLRNFGLKYDPDIVVQMFLTANDVKNNSSTLQDDPYRPYFKIDESGELEQIPHGLRGERRLSELKEKLKALRMMEVFLSVRHKVIERNKATAWGYPTEYHVYDQEYGEEYKEAWEVTKKLILATKKETESSGAKYILVTLSNNEQVHNDVWEEAKETYPEMKNVEFDLEKPEQMLAEFCKEQKITCFQMLPKFKEYVANNPEVRTHNRYEGHWNQTGTDLAAQFLIDVLQEEFQLDEGVK
jgi:hypothetical protein